MAVVVVVLAITAAGGALLGFESGSNSAVLLGFPFVLFFAGLFGQTAYRIGIADRPASSLPLGRSAIVSLFGLVAGAAAVAIALTAYRTEIDRSDDTLLLASVAVAAAHIAAQLGAQRRVERSTAGKMHPDAASPSGKV